MYSAFEFIIFPNHIYDLTIIDFIKCVSIINFKSKYIGIYIVGFITDFLNNFFSIFRKQM